MKFNFYKLFIFLPLVFISDLVWALSSDSSQPINIDSGNQSADLDKNIIVFDNNVSITQGSIQIKADKVTIIRPKTEKQKDKVNAEGRPVLFQQTLDDGKIVKGKANHIEYDFNTEFVILLGKAELKQQDNILKAEKITYDIKKQQLKALSSNNGRVQTVLTPNQVEKK